MHMMSTNTRLVFCCLTFVGIFGKDLDPSCKVALKVPSGTTWKAVPQQKLTINCTVKLCGETLPVTWHKFQDKDTYEQITDTENVEIRQIYKVFKDELISFLNFKRISTRDAGIYVCKTEGYKYSLISHLINVLVSDSNQAVESYRNITHVPVFSAANKKALYNDKSLYWLPYFAICISIVFLVLLLTAITKLSFNCCTRLQLNNQPQCQEMPTQRLPDIPKGHNSFDCSLQRTAETPCPPVMSNMANIAEENHHTDNPLYA